MVFDIKGAAWQKENMNAMTTDFARASKISFGNHTIMATLKLIIQYLYKKTFPTTADQEKSFLGRNDFLCSTTWYLEIGP